MLETQQGHDMLASAYPRLNFGNSVLHVSAHTVHNCSRGYLKFLTSERWGIIQRGDEQRKVRYQRLTSFLGSLRSAKLLAFYEAEDLKGPWQCSELAWARHMGPLRALGLPLVSELPKLVRSAFADHHEKPQDDILQEVRSSTLLSRLQTLLAVQAEYGWMQAPFVTCCLGQVAIHKFSRQSVQDSSCAGMHRCFSHGPGRFFVAASLSMAPIVPAR